MGWKSFATGVKEFCAGDYFVAPLAIDYSADGACLAAAGEAGILTITNHSNQQHHTFDLGTGDAMTDLQWNKDQKLLMPSADGYCYIYDAERIADGPVVSFDGGGEAVKCGRWSDHLVGMAGRDGDIRLYDCRSASKSSRLNVAVLTISMAHKRNRSNNSMVSCIQFLPHQPHYLSSIGQPDYNVNIWDCRYTKTSFPSEVIVNPTITGKRLRAFVDISCSPDGAYLYAVNSNNTIYKFALSNFELERELSHPQLRTGSFYLRSALSADGRFIACGSAGDGAVWVFGTDSDTIIRLRNDPYEGEHLECTGVAWRPNSDSMAASLDSGVICFWGDDHGHHEGTMFKAERLYKPQDDSKDLDRLNRDDNQSSVFKKFSWPSLDSQDHILRPITPAISDSPLTNNLSKKARTILDYFPSSGRPSPIKKPLE